MTTTTSTSGTSGSVGTKNVIRAPAWGETELPPLPPSSKRSPPSLPRRPSGINSSTVAEQPRPTPKPPPPATGAATARPSKPALPARTPSYTSNGSTETRRVPPQLPARRPSSHQPAQSPGEQDATTGVVRSVSRRLPPVVSPNEISKIRQSSLSVLSKHAEEPEAPVTNGHSNQSAQPEPPPVPLASRPDLSAIQATKPKFQPSASQTSNAMCLKCRDFSGPDNHAAQFPRTSLPTHDLGWLAQQLTAPFPSLTDKARAIFTWLHHNIRYDVDAFFNNKVKPSTPAQTMQTGLAVCEGYAGLFATLAAHAGLDAHVIGGHGKGYGYTQLPPGASLPAFESNHAWNVVRIDGGQWKLIDCCWGAGAVENKGQPTFIHRFDPEQFTQTNDEFLLKHYPERIDQFYTDDGRPKWAWEEYILHNPDRPFGVEPPTIFNVAHEEGISRHTVRPVGKQVSINQPGPMRFQFGLICEHWSVTLHGKKSAPYLFLLHTHGVDGRKDEMIPFTHVRGTAPNGGGDWWYVDIADPRILGAPGQKLGVAFLTQLGQRTDGRGLSVEEFRANFGRVNMAWSYVLQWELVA